MDNSTIVCKCEEINIDEIETAIKMGANQFDDIKRLTRCGMGPCQAKTCMNLVRELISKATGRSPDEIAYPQKRMPIKVTRMSALAANQKSMNIVSVFKEAVTEMDSP